MPLIRRWVTEFEEDDTVQIRIHKWAIRFWVVNFIAATSVFFFASGVWAQLSVYYLVAVSLYANFATDYGALSAAQASLRARQARDAAEEAGS